MSCVIADDDGRRAPSSPTAALHHSSAADAARLALRALPSRADPQRTMRSAFAHLAGERRQQARRLVQLDERRAPRARRDQRGLLRCHRRVHLHLSEVRGANGLRCNSLGVHSLLGNCARKRSSIRAISCRARCRRRCRVTDDMSIRARGRVNITR